MLSQQNLEFKVNSEYSARSNTTKKLPRITARYIEVEQFKDSDHHKGYFSYNCAYFVKPHHSAIVTDEGVDTMGHSAGVTAPRDCVRYGCQIKKRSMVVTLLIEYLVQKHL